MHEVPSSISRRRFHASLPTSSKMLIDRYVYEAYFYSYSIFPCRDERKELTLRAMRTYRDAI